MESIELAHWEKKVLKSHSRKIYIRRIHLFAIVKNSYIFLYKDSETVRRTLVHRGVSLSYQNSSRVISFRYANFMSAKKNGLIGWCRFDKGQ